MSCKNSLKAGSQKSRTKTKSNCFTKGVFISALAKATNNNRKGDDMKYQKIDFKQGDLVNPENGHILTQIETDSYNRYSIDINNATNDNARQILLNNRCLYLKLCGTNSEG